MLVTDDQVATLRAQLRGNREEYEQRWGKLDAEEVRAYTVLVSAGFVEAVEKRFPGGASRAQVVNFVADVRTRTVEAQDRLDPTAAERLIQRRLGNDNEPVTDIDDATVGSTQMIILAAIVAEARLDDQQLDKFMGDIQKVANEWLAGQTDA